MSRTVTITGDQLTNALRALGVNFIFGGQSQISTLHKQPVRLITALASSEEARLRLSLIALFLERPELSKYVRSASQKLENSARVTLQFYYTASVWIGEKHGIPMPDLFSKGLKLLSVDDPDENLKALAKLQKQITNSRVNWLGTYQHAEQIWLKGLERQAQ